MIAIENKVWSGEGDDQLAQYKQAIEKKYKDKANRYFIYLTPSGDKPSENEENLETSWLVADYQTIYNVIDKILRSNNRDMPEQARMILESYNDLLIKEGIVSNNDLTNLCDKIWRSHKKALDVLMDNRPDNIKHISEIINDYLKGVDEYELIAKQNTKTIFRFKTKIIKQKFKEKKQDFYYYLAITDNGLWLGLIIKEIDDEFRKALFNSLSIKSSSQKTIFEKEISHWDSIREDAVEKKDELPHKEEFIACLKKLIAKLKEFEEELNKAIH